MIKTKSNRYIENKYNFETEKNILDCDKLTNLIKNNFIYSLNYQLKNSPPNSKLSRLSDNNEEDDFSIYTGTGGNIYSFWRIYINSLRSEQNFLDSPSVYLGHFKKALEVNLSLVEKDKYFPSL